MRYENIKEGIFISRPNRFIAEVEIGGNVEICHVKNTGRCRELLIPGATVYLQEFPNSKRRTRFDLVAVKKGDMLINMDSQAPNRLVYEWIMAGNYFEGLTFIKPETKYGDSRFDLYLEAGGERIFAEIKGVTLEEDGVVRFPDAPTERGVKHISELISAVGEGYGAYLFFVIQMEKCTYFTPNEKTHPEFASKLREADRRGVRIVALNCLVDTDGIVIKEFVPVRL